MIILNGRHRVIVHMIKNNLIKNNPEVLARITYPKRTIDENMDRETGKKRGYDIYDQHNKKKNVKIYSPKLK